MYKRGEIVLIPVPFTDLSSSKKRPVIIVSSDEHNSLSEDVICMAITSQIRGLDYEIIIGNKDMENGKLPKESCIRADKIYTLNRSIIVKKYGNLKLVKLNKAVSTIEKIIKPNK